MANWGIIHPGLLIVGLSFLMPLSVELQKITPEQLHAMIWFDWVKVFMECTVAGLVTLKAYLDPSIGQKNSQPDPLKPV